MTVCGTAFFMKSVKNSTPTVAIVLTKLTYIAILYTAYCILNQQVCKNMFICLLNLISPGYFGS